jgi:SpoU rRNA methylase family enzyme
MSAAALVGVASALVLARERWRGVAAVAAVASVVTLGTAAGIRILLLTELAAPLFTVEPEIWTLAGLGLVTAIAIAALRTRSGRGVDLAAMIVLSAAVGAFTIAELAVFDTAQSAVRVLLMTVVLSAAATAGWALRRRNGLVLLGAAGAFALVTAASTAPAVITMIEVITVPPAVAGLAVGVARMRAEPTRRSWPALGGWLALLTLPSLAYDVDPDAALWRVIALGAVAIALVVIGAVRGLQAPLVVGSAVLLVHAIAQLWPWIAAAYVAFWWLWLGLGGAALIFLAARYEKRMRALKAAFAAVTALR